MTARPGDNAIRAVIYALIAELAILASIVASIALIIVLH